jgi:hypothetical protein
MSKKAKLPRALPIGVSDQPENLQSSEVVGIVITKETIANMEKERILVADFAIVDILQRTKLSQKAQEDAVDRLVDRTLNWMKLKEEVRIDKIKTVLTEETVIEYLRHEGIIRKDADMVEAGVDKEGSIVVTVFYTKVPRAIRRAIAKETNEKKVREMETTLNILDQDMDLVQAAAAKLASLKQPQKVVPFKPRRK